VQHRCGASSASGTQSMSEKVIRQATERMASGDQALCLMFIHSYFAPAAELNIAISTP
jgi:N-methylhydantoinase A/oxoprolinase/acetone carboxylase beta subunit